MKFQNVEIAEGERHDHLLRIQNGILKVLDHYDIPSEDALNVLTNLVAILAVENCIPREDVTAAVGDIYDAHLHYDSKDETFN